jgi:hypothetical protein
MPGDTRLLLKRLANYSTRYALVVILRQVTEPADQTAHSATSTGFDYSQAQVTSTRPLSRDAI